MQAANYIINMTSVTIDTYTTGNGVPASSTIFATDMKINIFSSDTVMNLIVNNTLNLNKVINAGSFTQSEIAMLSKTNINIHLHRSSLIINNINIIRNLTADVAKQTIFVAPIYLQNKYVKMTNMNIIITGFILYSYDPMSLYVQNTYVQYDYTLGGFVIDTTWNYPEAYLYGNVIIDNLTAIDSQVRYAPFLQGILLHSGAENVTVNNTVMKIWTSLTNDKGQIEKHLTSECNPQDDVVIVIQILNTYWTMDYNPTNNRFNQFYNELMRTFTRKVIVNYSGSHIRFSLSIKS